MRGPPARDKEQSPWQVQDRRSESADAVVVGGGRDRPRLRAGAPPSAGSTSLVIERERPGAGASNVAAGMLAPVGEASWGEDRLLELALASHRLWPEFAAELAAATGARNRLPRARARCTSRSTATRRPSCGGGSSSCARTVSSAEWLPPSACRELEPGLGPGGHGGVHAPHEAAVDPRALTAALAAAFEAAGGRIEIAEVDRRRARRRPSGRGARPPTGAEHRAARRRARRRAPGRRPSGCRPRRDRRSGRSRARS